LAVQSTLEKKATEKADKQLREAGRAYAVLTRIFSERERMERRERLRRKAIRSAIVATVAIVILSVAMLIHNRLTIRAVLVSFSDGDEVFFRANDSYFGTVVGYESDHQFRVGTPVPAYKIRLANSETEIWMSKQHAAKSLYAAKLKTGQTRDSEP
jgi:hypothetical protein